ncbi:uncharacterized protein [Watersipora subatra]|uniref:uncharacterized protein n=1 Tax=Watersipora subatra TaxID=2589382 RepID=UPI00355AEA13
MLLNTISIGLILCVSCVLPSFANVIPCTTESSKTISCLVSEDKDECSDQSNIRLERSVFSQVINHTGLVFKSPGNDFNSLTISWNAPSAQDLYDAEGYMLKIYRYLDGRSLELCRVLNVTSNESSVSVSDAAVTFNYTIEEIASGDDVLYSYEIYTLPLTSPEPSRFSSNYTQSLSTVTASPQIYDEETMNLTASNPIPYRIIGRFRRASHYPTLSEDNKFSCYRVLLKNPETGSIIKDFMNESEITADNIPPDGDEYASFTFDAVPPGTYLIQCLSLSLLGGRYRRSLKSIAPLLLVAMYLDIVSDNTLAQSSFRPIGNLLGTLRHTDVESSLKFVRNTSGSVPSSLNKFGYFAISSSIIVTF